MTRALILLALLPLLSGCVVATVAGVAVGAAKATGRAVGTVVETAVDATTTTQQEADEDRGRAIRLEEERQAKEAERQRKAAEKAARESGAPPVQPAPADTPGPTR